MAEHSAIAWTDSTFNPWIGCTKVGPGCDHCYAEALDKRHRWQGDTHWGAGKPRMRTSAANWAKPRAWNKARQKDGKTHRVFCASLADVFDNEVPVQWRNDLFNLIWETPALTWLLLTKRIGNARHMLPLTTLRNVWLGATIVDQEEADRDVPKLLATPAAVRFVSYEPALGPVDFSPWLRVHERQPAKARYDGEYVVVQAQGNEPLIDWIIVGGESTQGAQARLFDPEWARSVIAQCRESGAAPFVKQLGSRLGFKDRAGADPAEWSPFLRVQEFPT